MKLLKLMMRTMSLIVITGFLSSCSTKISAYKDTGPKLELDTYFNGPLVAWGMVQDYSKNVTRRFCVEMQGNWQKNVGTLAETFYFNDGEVSQRNWQLTRNEKGMYQGRADDVIGVATGEQHGFALQWQYQLSVDIDEKTYTFSLDDWMYRIDNFRVFNRTDMKKFGITVAEITIFFDKQQPLRRCDVMQS